MTGFSDHISAIKSCTLCADRFAATATAHQPRPVVWLSQSAPILLIGQAPGARVHDSGKPFTDPSGDRLRQWMGIGATTFYNRNILSIFPMAFCFPGYNAKGADLPPPKICATTWRADTLRHMSGAKLVLMVGGYAQSWHLKTKNVTQTVQNWRSYSTTDGPDIIPLPHPSWRNTAWIKKNPWFETDLIPDLQSRIKALI